MMEHPFDTSTPTTITARSTTTLILAKNSGRCFAQIKNDSDIVVYLSLGSDAVMNKGIRLGQDESFIIDNKCPFKGEVQAICASTASLSVIEAP